MEPSRQNRDDALVLRVAMHHRGHTAALEDGTVAAAGLRLQFTAAPVLRTAMADMIRGEAFDLCEMSPTSYLLARERGAPLMALPIPLYRQFPLGLLMKPRGSPLSGPAALVGQTIAARTWAQPTAVWLRGILSTAYGLALDTLTWLLIADDPVPDLALPAHVRRAADATLEGLLRTGQAQAAIGPRTDDPDLARVFPDAVERARVWYRQTGVIPMNHLLVVREAVVAAQPWVPEALLAAFEEAKAAYLAGGGGADRAADADRHLADLVAVVGRDNPLPYGAAANWPALALLMELMVAQGLLPRPLDPGRVLAPAG